MAKDFFSKKKKEGYQEQWRTEQTSCDKVLTSETSPVKLAFSINWGWALYAMKHNAENALAAANCISLTNKWGSSVSVINTLIRYRHNKEKNKKKRGSNQFHKFSFFRPTRWPSEALHQCKVSLIWNIKPMEFWPTISENKWTSSVEMLLICIQTF